MAESFFKIVYTLVGFLMLVYWQNFMQLPNLEASKAILNVYDKYVNFSIFLDTWDIFLDCSFCLIRVACNSVT